MQRICELCKEFVNYQKNYAKGDGDNLFFFFFFYLCSLFFPHFFLFFIIISLLYSLSPLFFSLSIYVSVCLYIYLSLIPSHFLSSLTLSFSSLSFSHTLLPLPFLLCLPLAQISFYVVLITSLVCSFHLHSLIYCMHRRL